MKNCLQGLAAFVLLFSIGAQASQFRAVVKETQKLLMGPGEKYPELAAEVKQNEPVLILGNSTGGVWMSVMQENGNEGWILATKLDLYKIAPYELDDLEEAWQRKRRVISNWVIDTGLVFSAAPNSLGIGATVWWIPFQKGLLAQKSDQIEFGAGFRLGTRVSNRGAPDGSSFSEMPFMVQWMFRMPPRGSLMAGPKVGFSLMQDAANPDQSPAAFVWGATLRYFPYDNFGFFLDLVTIQRLKFFISREAGVSFRF